MKKFTKLFLSCAAVAAVTAAVATSAMAANVTGDVTGTYDEETNALNLTTGIESGTTTILVVGPGVDITKEITDADIVYINQVDGDVPADMGLLSAANGVYNVYVANETDDYDIKAAQFRIGPSTGETIIVGDVDLNGAMNTQDPGYILRKIAGQTTLVGSAGLEVTGPNGTVIIGDVDLNGAMNTQDPGYILRKIAGQTTLVGSAGEEIEVVLP